MDARVDLILLPVPGDDPCGEDLSFSPEFDRIQEARRADDPTVDYGEWQSTLKQADWRIVIDSCSELLHGRSKDLRLCAWFAEAAVKTSGLAGLCEGVATSASLLAHFGAALHPRGENEADHERRIGTVSWFVARMSQLVKQIPITRCALGNYSLCDHEAARLLQAQLQRNQDSGMDPGEKLTLERFAAAVAKTDKTLYRQWLEEADRCGSSLRELAEVSDALFGADGPSFAPLDESLDELCQRLQAIGREIGITVAEPSPDAGGPDDTVSTTSDAAVAVEQGGAIKTRAQALAALRQVAAFFRQTEPHSPVSYLADKAAYWGDMPLHAWLRSVVKDHGTLSNIEELLGVLPYSKDPGEGG